MNTLKNLANQLGAKNLKLAVALTVLGIADTIGMATAVTISYNENHSIFWAITHGTLSWIYVIYSVVC